MRKLFLLFICLSFPTTASAITDKGFEQLQTFSRVLHHIVSYHVEPPEENELLQGAIRGLFDSLDPHSAYLPPKVFRALQSETGGRFAGIGIEVVMKQGWLTVVAPIDGSPAAAAGIKPGDRIVKIGGTSTKTMGINEAVAKMRGRPGSRVVLTLLRRGSRVPFDVSLRRAIIQVPSVRSEMAAPGYLYTRLTGFKEQTHREFLRAIEEAEQSGPLKGLILDMRNNPGGLLDQAVAISDLFLSKGVIVTTSSRGKEIARHEAHPQGTKANFPIAILVNGGSASASEIVTGALQDYKRAAVLGSQTFGKGSVQTVIEFEDGSALKLTVARYYTPKKRSIQTFGITPDIIIPENAPGQGPVAEITADVETEKEKKRRKRKKRRNKTKLPQVTVPANGGDYQRAVALKLLQNGTITKMTRIKRQK